MVESDRSFDQGFLPLSDVTFGNGQLCLELNLIEMLGTEEEDAIVDHIYLREEAGRFLTALDTTDVGNPLGFNLCSSETALAEVDLHILNLNSHHRGLAAPRA